MCGQRSSVATIPPGCGRAGCRDRRGVTRRIAPARQLGDVEDRLGRRHRPVPGRLRCGVERGGGRIGQPLRCTGPMPGGHGTTPAAVPPGSFELRRERGSVGRWSRPTCRRAWCRRGRAGRDACGRHGGLRWMRSERDLLDRARPRARPTIEPTTPSQKVWAVARLNAPWMPSTICVDERLDRGRNCAGMAARIVAPRSPTPVRTLKSICAAAARLR